MAGVWDVRHAREAHAARVFNVGSGSCASTVTLDDSAVVLERGAAWSAPIYFRPSSGLAAAHLAPLVDGAGKRQVDLTRVASIIGEAIVTGETRTIYQGVNLVRPFETIVLKNDSCTSTVRATPRVERLAPQSIEDLALELRRRLIDAVDRETRNARVAVMLSGGMDSSALLAALFALRGARAKDVVALTIDFEGAGDDRPHIRTLENYFGISVERIAPRDVPAEDALVLDQAPSRHHGDMWIIACARRAHALGAEVLVTGTGGDRFFGGSLSTSIRDAVRDHDLEGGFDAFRAVFPYRFSLRARAGLVARSLIRHRVPRFVRQLRRKRAITAPTWAGPVLRDELARSSSVPVNVVSTDPQTRLDDAMTDPFESEYAAEARAQTDSVGPIPRVDPLYDLDLVRFLVGIRQQALFTGGTFRGLLRLAMKGMLPESVRNRIDKARFEPALAQAVSLERFRGLLTFEAMADAGLVDPKRFRAVINPLIERPADGNLGELWVLLMPALASEAFLRV